MNIKQLQERYSIKSRSALYARINSLSISLNKDPEGISNATPEQIALLDQLDSHIKNGGSMKTFSPVATPQISVGQDPRQDREQNSQNSANELKLSSKSNTVLFKQNSTIEPQDFLQLVNAIATNLKPSSPIEHWKELILADEHNLVLSTSGVKSLVGTAPKGQEWIRGAFKFIRAGKIGNQSGWKVERF